VGNGARWSDSIFIFRFSPVGLTHHAQSQILRVSYCGDFGCAFSFDGCELLATKDLFTTVSAARCQGSATHLYFFNQNNDEVRVVKIEISGPRAKTDLIITPGFET
jgi:hypothetical protein